MAEFEIYDLRITVVSIEGRAVCGLQVGDYFELVESSKIRIPAGKHFCMYAFSSVLPLLAAKQRFLSAGDWMERDSLVACPDPEDRLIMKIERIGKRTMNSDDLTLRQISVALQTDKTPSDYIALARLIDRYAFDVVSVYCDAPYHPSYAPLILMAPHLHRARLGAAAIPPARMHPIDIAAQTALLAQMAQGGVYIGMARGAWLADHGITESNKPIQAIREAAGVIRYLLEGKTGGYPGEIYTLAPHVRAPYPLPTERIPLMIGSWGKTLCALAGEIADEVKVGGSANRDLIPVIRDYIAVGERKANRPNAVSVCLGAVTVIDEDREVARAAARRSVALYLPVVAPLDPTVNVEPELVTRLRQYVEQGDSAAAARLISDDLLDRFAFAGDANDLIRQSEAIFAAGGSRIEFGTPHGLPSAKGIQLLGEQVIPALRR